MDKFDDNDMEETEQFLDILIPWFRTYKSVGHPKPELSPKIVELLVGLSCTDSLLREKAVQFWVCYGAGENQLHGIATMIFSWLELALLEDMDVPTAKLIRITRQS